MLPHHIAFEGEKVAKATYIYVIQKKTNQRDLSNSNAVIIYVKIKDRKSRWEVKLHVIINHPSNTYIHASAVPFVWTP